MVGASGTARGPFPTDSIGDSRKSKKNGGGNAARPTGTNSIRRAENSDQSRGPNGVIQPPTCQNELAPGPAGRPVGKFYSTFIKHNPPVTSLSAATGRRPNNKRTTRGEGGPFIRSQRGEPGSVGRGNFIRALCTRHKHYNKQSKFRQSLESKKMNRFQIVKKRKKRKKSNKKRTASFEAVRGAY